jgi:thiaminase
VYLDVWTKVLSQLENNINLAGDIPATVAALVDFATNWSSPEFKTFVDDLADIVNSFGTVPGTSAWTRSEEIWYRVIELEADFWPNADEMDATQR